MNDIKVSIVCITYNHEDYIRDCLDGFFMQKTNFPFEVLIHDDASTDKTANIIREYEAKYPNIIKSIYQTENQYSKGINPAINYLYPIAQGKYIALCEGDDYWTDPYKLQKQVDFLEENEDYALVHTNFKMFIQKENSFENVVSKRDTGYVFQNYLKGNQIGTLTVLVKRDIVLEAISQKFMKKKFLMDDYPLWLHIAQFHKIGYLDDVTAVYRVLPESMSNTQNEVKAAVFNNSVLEIRVYFAEKNNCINLILVDIVRAYKQQLNFGFENRHKELAVKAYDFLKKYNNVGFANYVKYIGVKFNLYKSADFILKIKNRIL